MLEHLITRTALAITLSLGLCHVAAAQEPIAADQPPPLAPPEPASAATVRLLYTGEIGWNPIGGIHDGVAYVNTFDAHLELDTNKLFNLPGGQAVLEGFYVSNNSFQQRFVGAVQDPSAIESDQGSLFRVYQAYYEQRFASTGTRVRFGIQDLELTFGNTRPMDIFFNGAYAWNSALDASGRNGPSTYPNPTLALNLTQRLGSDWSVQVAVADGVPDSEKARNSNAININSRNGAFLIGELDYQPTPTTKLLAGVWNYTGQFDALNRQNADGSQQEVFGSRGGYFGGATRLGSFGADRALDMFANLGIADGRTNAIDTSLNVGLNVTAPFSSRLEDQLGLAAGVVKASNAFKQLQLTNGARATNEEVNFELTYRAPINDWLTVQPDIQYWLHPGLDASRKNDLLMIMHFEIGHLFHL